MQAHSACRVPHNAFRTTQVQASHVAKPFCGAHEHSQPLCNLYTHGGLAAFEAHTACMWCDCAGVMWLPDAQKDIVKLRNGWGYLKSPLPR